MPSPRYGFRFESVSRLWNLNLTLSVYLGNATFAKILPFVYKFLTLIVAASYNEPGRISNKGQYIPILVSRLVQMTTGINVIIIIGRWSLIVLPTVKTVEIRKIKHVITMLWCNGSINNNDSIIFTLHKTKISMDYKNFWNSKYARNTIPHSMMESNKKW